MVRLARGLRAESLVMCFGVVFLLAASCAAQQQLPAPLTDHGPYSAGFRVLYPAREGGPQDLWVVAVWYPSEAAEQSYEYPGRGLPGVKALSRVAADAPAARRGGPYPLIIAAHGLFGSARGLAYLGEYLARHGYVVVSTDWRDLLAPNYTTQMAAGRLGPGNVFRSGLAFLAAARLWLRDMEPHPEKVLDYLERVRLRPAEELLDYALSLNSQPDSFLEGLIAEQRVGMMGHSLGGYTTLGLIGANPHPDFHDERIKAAVLLSCGFLPYSGHVQDVTVPALVMYGEHDPAGLGDPEDRYRLYAQLGGPRECVAIAGANHFTFSNPRDLPLNDCWQRDPKRAVIVSYVQAFFAAHLLGDEQAHARLHQPTAGVMYLAWQHPGRPEHTWGTRPNLSAEPRSLHGR
ncbi:MAG: hypothetical protein J7M26_05325 [Armatimonadetes bacterium]|nr:hypothetical protein [Armatimonadota bacterium]